MLETMVEETTYLAVYFCKCLTVGNPSWSQVKSLFRMLSLYCSFLCPLMFDPSTSSNTNTTEHDLYWTLSFSLTYAHPNPTQSYTHPPTHKHKCTPWPVPPNHEPPPAYCRTLCFANNREQAIYYSPLPSRPKNATRYANTKAKGAGMDEHHSHHHHLYHFDDTPKKIQSTQSSNLVKSYKKTKGQEVANQGTNHNLKSTFVAILFCLTFLIYLSAHTAYRCLSLPGVIAK